MKLLKWFLISILFTSCAKEITDKTFPSNKVIPNSKQVALSIPGKTSDLKMLYLGCGHLVIEYQQEIIVVDPFFSIQPFSLFKKIKSNTADFDTYRVALNEHQVDLSKTKSIWLAHTHYDHMMDIPMMAEKSLIPVQATIYGNEFGDDILQNFPKLKSQYKELLPNQVYDPLVPAGPIPDSIPASQHITIRPILSDHAPHWRVLGINIHLMKGKLKGEYFKKKFNAPESKTKKGQWSEGCVYSFLVDFIVNGKIDYRVFIQTSGSHFPLGLPPPEILEQRSVDVALVCLASANYVEPYPVEILKVLNPDKTIFIHWEDFFIRTAFGKNKLVRLTNFRKLDKLFKGAGFKLEPENYVMPRPGTLISIN
jgi:hypothetical protein